jgi:trk system potassium uptake protein TrkH
MNSTDDCLLRNSFNLIHKKISMSYNQAIALSFALIILAGGILLTLPISAKSGQHTPFLDALFTSASATCVTGLVVHDTYLYWSHFGQAVILLLIQIGGLGFMTMAILFSMILITNVYPKIMHISP